MEGLLASWRPSVLWDEGIGYRVSCGAAFGHEHGSLGLSSELLDHDARRIAGGGIGETIGRWAEGRLAVIGDFIPVAEGGVAVEEAVGGVGGAVARGAQPGAMLGDDSEIGEGCFGEPGEGDLSAAGLWVGA